ncbi:MAG: DUF4270 family protein [Bacteroidota bacterium]
MAKPIATLFTLCGSTALFFYSCNPPNELGATFLPEAVYAFNQVADFPLEVQTLQYEDIISTDANRLLLGKETHPELGQLNATAYLQFFLDDIGGLEEDNSYRFDSITLSLDYDGYYENDTLQPLNFSLHRILADFEPEEDESQFYTDDQLNYADVPFSSHTVFTRPLRGEPLEVRLPDSLGRDFLQKLIDEESELLNIQDFQDYFRGLALVPTADGPILGFSRSSQIRLYLTNINQLPTEQLIRTYSVAEARNFNQILSDRSATLLARLDEDHPLSSDSLFERSYLQSGTGLTTSIRVKDWELLRETYGESIVNRALLRFRALDVELEEQTALPAQLNVYWLDKDDDIINSNDPASLVVDTEFGRDTYYEIDLTQFIKYMLLPETPEDHGLLLALSLDGDSTAKLIIGAADHPQPMELLINFLSLND